MRSKTQRKQKDGSLKKEGTDQVGGLPNPDLPLSQQLEQSFDTIKSHSQTIKVILKETILCLQMRIYMYSHKIIHAKFIGLFIILKRHCFDTGFKGKIN